MDKNQDKIHFLTDYWKRYIFIIFGGQNSEKEVCLVGTDHTYITNLFVDFCSP